MPIKNRILPVVIGVHVAAFIWAFSSGNIYLADSSGYLHQAFNLKTYGSWYSEDWNAPLLLDYFSYRTPGYAIFILCCKFIWDSVWSVLLFQNILSIYTCYVILRQLEKSSVTAAHIRYIMYTFLLLYPAQVMLANMVMSEMLFQFLLIQFFLALVRYSETPHYKTLVAPSLWLVCLIATKPVALFLPAVAVVCIATINFRISLKRTALHGILVAAIAGISIHAICTQQVHQLGYYHFSSIKPVTMQRYYAKFILANEYGRQVADDWNDRCYSRLQNCSTYKERYELMQHMGDSVVKKYPLTAIYLYTKGAAAMLLDPGRHELVRFTGLDNPALPGLFYTIQSGGYGGIRSYLQSIPLPALLLLILSLLWNVSALFLLVVYILRVHHKAVYKRILLLIVAYMVLTTGMLGISRYRSAIMPLLVIAAGIGLSHVLTKKQVSN
ncbi:MAG: hypothetical protein ACK5HJ_09710 [Bacteroidota bacterium]